MARLLLALVGLLCWFANRQTCAWGSSTNSGSGGMYVSPAHSFNSPFTVNDLNNGWVINYSTASTNKYLVLIPNVYNRRGFLYHSKPLLSDTLNIEFSFHIKKQLYREHIDERYYKTNQVKETVYKTATEEKNKINGFAFWLLPNEFSLQNVNAEGENQLEEDQFGLYGFKKDFNGIGVGFQLRANDFVLSGLINNGKKNRNVKENVTKSYNLSLLSMDELVYVKITTQKNEMRVYLFNASNNSYIHSLTVKKQIPRENYIGFSAFNYKENELLPDTHAEKYVPTFVGITHVSISSSDIFPDGQQGEYSGKEADSMDESEEQHLGNDPSDVLSGQDSSHPNYHGYHNQAEALNSLNATLQQFMSYQISSEKKILQSLNTLQESIQYLHAELKQVKKNVVTKSEDPKHFQKIFTTELSGLKSLFHSHAQHSKKNMEDITDRLTKRINENQELKLLAEKAQKLETIISKGNSTSYHFSFAFAALIILTLILIYKKIRDVEKKHIL
ncbi:parasite-infected erythrocyte surface protein, putative [Plasmodium vivax]|uniref:Parasite-infected erythrocyte surface protein, putative n=1 Tax=Plasmodium vivax TaxID=5855 RepID=A0A564ZNR6_PLAVI|nr:parasite-infected erythrocyte surface protein, putative [Plasmodium vivax]